MVFHMKTTLIIADPVYKRLKAQAARHRTTISELVEAALRRFLERKPPLADLPEPPVFRCGEPLVDISNREALYDAMEHGRSSTNTFPS